MSIRLYFDEDAHGRLAGALRRDGLDVETTNDAGRLCTNDADQLAYAVSQRRALVTHNIRHFPGLHAAWLAAGHDHHGIVILIDPPDIGTWLRRMRSLLTRFGSDALRNNLFFLGTEFDTRPE